MLVPVRFSLGTWYPKTVLVIQQVIVSALFNAVLPFLRAFYSGHVP